jgi:hypothetical protein
MTPALGLVRIWWLLASFRTRHFAEVSIFDYPDGERAWITQCDTHNAQFAFSVAAHNGTDLIQFPVSSSIPRLSRLKNGNTACS